MNKPMITLAALSILGAGGLIYWQNSGGVEAEAQQGEPTQEVARSSKIAAKPTIIDRITDQSIRWEVRVDILSRLDASKLSEEEIDTLYELLTYSPSPIEEKSWWTVVNEIMEQMRIKSIGSDRYTPALLAIIADRDAPEVLRDYAVQHVSQWVTPRGAAQGAAHETDEALIQDTVGVLSEVIQDESLAHTSIPGTTLMALVDMKSGGVSGAILDPAIDSLQPWFESTLTGTNSVSKITRISAINVIGMLRLDEHGPVIRQLAESESTNPSIRLSSIASLGSIGAEDDLPILETIAVSKTRYRHAAKTAISKIKTSYAEPSALETN